LRRCNLPVPEVQARIGRYRADFVWRAQMLLAESDGYEAHRGRLAFRDDRAKDRALAPPATKLLRFTWSEVVGAPERVVRDLRSALRRRGVRPRCRG
jgi:very-short-patch-repair endonuclease